MSNMRKALCTKRTQLTHKWEIVQYKRGVDVKEICILENDWREQKENAWFQCIAILLSRILPMDIVKHIRQFVGVWRATDAQLVKYADTVVFFKIELSLRNV